MDVKKLNEVTELKLALEKSLVDDDSDKSLDVLKCLKTIYMTIDLLKKTKVGAVVNEAKRKLSSTNPLASNIAKELIANWKKIYEASTKVSAGKLPEEGNSLSAPISIQEEDVHTIVTKVESNAIHATEETKESETSIDKSMSADDHETLHINNLIEVRRKVVDSIKESLQGPSVSSQIASALACGIEASINNLHPYHAESKSYGAKARKLAFNLKKNEQLRDGLVAGDIPLDALVHMSANDLATQEQKNQRQAASKADIDARRSDYYQVNRDKIMRSVGLDPTKGGEFRCRKCGQNKTTHYSLQTRSADEPMTVFVTCLTCSNRWKTQ